MYRLLLKVLDEELYTDELGDRGFGPRKPGDAGVDLRSTETRKIGHRETAKIGLGVAIALPFNTVGWLTGRSSTALTLGLLTHEGKIDAGYRGQIHAILTALDGDCVINRGERIAQLVIVRICPPLDVFSHWEIVQKLDNSERGSYGLGSTGRD